MKTSWLAAASKLDEIIHWILTPMNTSACFDEEDLAKPDLFPNSFQIDARGLSSTPADA